MRPAIALLLLAQGLAAQSGPLGARDTVYRAIVGRNETAQLWIDFAPRPGLSTEPSSAAGAPQSLGGGSPVFLRADRPIQIGAALLPIGRYRLWIGVEGTSPVLIATSSMSGSDSTFVSRDEVARTPLVVDRLDHPVERLSISFRIDRRGPDTLATVDRSTKTQTVSEIQMRPGTVTTLVIMTGHAVLSATLAAR